MKAQKKPVTIDYFEVKDLTFQLDEIRAWVKSFGDDFDQTFERKNEGLFVLTLEGSSYAVSNEDMIIRGVKGEYYPCKKEVFFETYDVISS